MKKLTIEVVRKEFEKENYILLSDEYKNNYTKLNYICPKGHKHSVSWSHWDTSKTRCPYCDGQGKPTIGFIKVGFEKEGYKLISNIYKNSHSKLNYICPKSHQHDISWTHWQRGVRCPYCSGKGKPSINFIRQQFEKESYTLLTEVYKNARQKLNYICPKGHEHSMTWDKWQQGRRCPTCYSLSKFGSGNPAWKGGISCEPYCFEWSSKEFKDFIKERDGNGCLNPACFGNIHRLSVHHIDYNKKNCEPQNLITLCTSCNSRANKDRGWHEAWYQIIINKRYYEKN